VQNKSKFKRKKEKMFVVYCLLFVVLEHFELIEHFEHNHKQQTTNINCIFAPEKLS